MKRLTGILLIVFTVLTAVSAEKKISELNSLAAVNWATTDLIPIVDVSASETKKTTIADFDTRFFRKSTDVLAITAGGTGLSAVPAAGNFIYSNGTVFLSVGSACTSGQVLASNGSGVWACATPSGGSSSPLTTKGDVWGFSTVDARIPIGTNGQVLTADSAQALGLKWATVSGTGDVVGPGSATDNAIARFDSTTGKLIQNSGASIDDSGNITATNLSGTNTGDQTISLTGDVTGSGTGSFAATIAANAVSNAKLAQMAAHTFKGNNTGSTANALDLTATQLTAELNQFSSSLQGVVPGSGGGTTNFLRADGSWAAPSGGGSGTVTSVDASVPSSILSISGNPVTTSGTLAFDLVTQVANRIWAGPTTGADANPTFRALVSNDIPSLSAAKITSGQGTLSTTTSGVTVGSGSNALLTSATVDIQTASGSQPGLLSSTDWTTFNGKFTLPSLTAGSVIFSDGSTLVEDNTNFFWDNSLKTFFLGHNSDPSGVNYSINVLRSLVDPSENVLGNTKLETDLEFTDDSTDTVNNINNVLKMKVASGKSLNSLAVGNLSLYSRVDAADAGAVQYGAGYYAQLAFGNSSTKTQGIWAGYLTGFNSIDGSGATVGAMYDFYGIGGSIPVGAVTNRYGIVIEPDANYVKKNWLSGLTQIGGATYLGSGVSLNVIGTTQSAESATDAGATGGIFNATSDTTTNGSNTTVGINGAASGTVQTGAENDKEVGGMNFAVTRGDGTDAGILDAMTGSNVLMFHNSDDAGVTNQVFGYSTVFFSQKGTATDLYDFYSQRVPAGTGVVTNHYGVYVKNDSDSPVKNWLSGVLQIGGSSFAINSDAALDIQGAKALLYPRLTTTEKNALTAVVGMTVYDTDLNEFDCYTGSWGNCGSGGGGGANQSLSNLTSPTAINQDLIFATGAAAFLKTKDDATAGTQNLTIASGDGTASTFASGALNIFTGSTVDTASGVLAISTGSVTSGGASSGALSIVTGATINETSGAVSIASGASEGLTGAVTVQSGDGAGANTATSNVSLLTGVASGTGASGDIVVKSGTSATGATGSVTLQVGTTGGSPQGNIFITGRADENDLTLSNGGAIYQSGALLSGNNENNIYTIRPSEKTLANTTVVAADITGILWQDETHAAVDMEYVMVEKSTGKVQSGVLHIAQDMNTAADVVYTDEVKIANSGFPVVVLSALSTGGNVQVQFTNASGNDILIQTRLVMYPANVGSL